MRDADEWQMPCGARVWGEDAIADHENDCETCQEAR